MSERFRQKTPVATRNSPGLKEPGFVFEPDGRMMYRVIPLNNREPSGEVNAGAERRTPPTQTDGFGNKIGNWWPDGRKGIDRQSIGREISKSNEDGFI